MPTRDYKRRKLHNWLLSNVPNLRPCAIEMRAKRRGDGLLRPEQPAVRVGRVLPGRPRALLRSSALYLRRESVERVPGRVLSGVCYKDSGNRVYFKYWMFNLWSEGNHHFIEVMECVCIVFYVMGTVRIFSTLYYSYWRPTLKSQVVRQ